MAFNLGSLIQAMAPAVGGYLTGARLGRETLDRRQLLDQERMRYEQERQDRLRAADLAQFNVARTREIAQTEAAEAAAQRTYERERQAITDRYTAEDRPLQRQLLLSQVQENLGQATRRPGGPLRYGLETTDTGFARWDPESGQLEPLRSDLRPPAPKRREPPAPVIDDLIANQSALRTIDEAITAVQASPGAATGAKNLFGQGVAGRLDPAGQKVRNPILDVVSLTIKDRSGGSVTPSEFERQGMLPNLKYDNEQVILDKLARMRRKVAEETEARRQVWKIGEADLPLVTPPPATGGDRRAAFDAARLRYQQGLR